MLSFYIYYIAPAFVLFPISTGAIFYTKLPPPYRILFFFVLLSGLTNLIAITLSATSHQNLLLLRAYTALEYLSISAFFRAQFSRYKFSRVIITVSMILFPLLCITDLFFQTTAQFDSYTSSFEAILIILMCLTLFYQIEDRNISSRWKDNPVNWFNTGLLLYFSGSMFLFLLSNYLLKAPLIVSYTAWAMHGTFSLVMYLMFSIGFKKCSN